jgi:hypothetical protein
MAKKSLSVCLSAALSLSVMLTGACGSSYTVLDRTIPASSNSQIVASTLLGGERNPALVSHLAIAEELYQQQLRLLHERRNKTRARKRDLGFAAFGLMGAAGLGVGGLAIGTAAGGGDSNKALVGAGVLSLVGLGVGTLLQLTAANQEEPSVADDKVRSLQRSYEAMLERVRALSQRAQENPAAAAATQAQIGATIESFIGEMQQINVKG